MANPNAVLATAFSLDGPWLEVEGDRRLRLDPEDPKAGGFAQILEAQQRQQRPVYVEFDPETSAVTGLRVPYVSPVLGIRFVDRGVFDVVLALSHARHVLRESAEDFETLRARLHEAIETQVPVILVDDDAHEILDVRLGREVPEPPFPEVPPRLRWPWRWWVDIRERLRRIWLWYWWPWWWFRCISAGHAQQVFNDLQATSCAPLTVPSPCIPFLYPDDGCWARASEMCRLMIQRGLRPRKVWIQGNLHVATRNNPTCAVVWNWHVAPTLCVRGPLFFQHQDMVIDPALFGTPVTKAQWKAVQGDPLATLTDTDASVYHLFYPPYATDPTYALTNQDLATYRAVLQARALSQGPPPYANCP